MPVRWPWQPREPVAPPKPDWCGCNWSGGGVHALGFLHSMHEEKVIEDEVRGEWYALQFCHIHRRVRRRVYEAVP